MAVAVNDIWKFALRQVLFGQEVINTFALKVTALGTATTETAFMSSLFTDTTGFFNQAGALRDVILDQQSNEVTHDSWIVERAYPNPTGVFTFALSDNVAGHINATCETANVSMSISRKALGLGRQYRGRIQLAGLPTTTYAAGVFGDNALADATAVSAKMIGEYSAAAPGTFQMGWYVYYPGPALNLFRNAITSTPKRTVRVQRSRTVGVGS